MAEHDGQLTSSRYEEEHVHSVYEAIAPHFAATRYKPWPVVEGFLLSLPSGSVGFDAGCGNGKYLSVNPALFILASDRSCGLVDIAMKYRRSPGSVFLGDTLTLPHPNDRFDFALSIAVIHHLSTRERRVDAVKELLRPLARAETSITKIRGRCLIFVWALEQKNSRRGWTEDSAQDVMVPWVLQGPKKQAKAIDKPSSDLTDSNSPPQVYNRYYHLYRQGELEEDVLAAGGELLDSGYEKDNWWAVAAPAS